MPNSLPQFEAHMSFLNEVIFLTKFISILKKELHTDERATGWQGLESLTCLSEKTELYDVDIRYAWGSEIFKQNLFDHGWNQDILLDRKLIGKLPRQKLIIYLCEPSTEIPQKVLLTQIPNHLKIGRYWQNIYHLYLSLPINHPFTLPQEKLQKYNQKGSYATTRYLYSDKPILFNQPESTIEGKLYLPPHAERKKEGGLRTQGLFKKATDTQPLVSIITVVLNGEKYIEQTIQSVINQTYENLEYVVIDGGSTDCTLDIIEKYNDQIDYWISEPDKGIYEAMNKGLQCITGDFVNFMNSGDLFYSPDAVKSMNLKKGQNSTCGINIFFSKVVEGAIFVGASNNSLPHQALFMARKDFEYNLFNTQFKYCADAELWTRFNPQTASIEAKPVCISLSRFGGVSTNKNYLLSRFKENLQFRRNKLKVIVRFLPKIVLSKLFNDQFLEYLYFVLKRK